MNYLRDVIKNARKGPKGLIILLIFYFGIFAAVLLKTLNLFKELVEFIKNWGVPEINLELGNQHSYIMLFCISFCTFISYVLVLISILKLNRATRLFSEDDVFVKKISNDFKISARFFLGFIIMTICIKITLIILSSSLVEAVNSFSIYTIYSSNISIYIVIYALLSFISDIIGRGDTLNEENQFTI